MELAGMSLNSTSCTLVRHPKTLICLMIIQPTIDTLYLLVALFKAMLINSQKVHLNFLLDTVGSILALATSSNRLFITSCLDRISTISLCNSDIAFSILTFELYKVSDLSNSCLNCTSGSDGFLIWVLTGRAGAITRSFGTTSIGLGSIGPSTTGPPRSFTPLNIPTTFSFKFIRKHRLHNYSRFYKLNHYVPHLLA